MPYSTDEVHDLLLLARKDRVERQCIAAVLNTPGLDEPLRQTLRDSLHHGDHWIIFIRKVTEDLFAALRAARCDAVLIKGFVLERHYAHAFGESFRRDQTDIDCAVRTFEDFLLFASIGRALGLTLKGLAIRKGRYGIAGVAEFFLPVREPLHNALSIECQFGGQPLSRFAMRDYDNVLWRDAFQPDSDSAVHMANPEQSFEILAGEVLENRAIRLRDYLDYAALAPALGTRTVSFSPYVHWLHDRMSDYARRNALIRHVPLPIEAAERGSSRAAPEDVQPSSGQQLYAMLRSLVCRFKADRLGAFLASCYGPAHLWEKGWYIDAIQINELPYSLCMEALQPYGSLLRTPIGDFVLVPFGIVTLADVRGLVDQAGT